MKFIRKKNRLFWILFIIGIIAVEGAFSAFQLKQIDGKTDDQKDAYFESIQESLDERTELTEEISDTHRGNLLARAEGIAYCMSDYDIVGGTEIDKAITEFKAERYNSSFDSFYAVDYSGKIIFALEKDLIGTDYLDFGYLTSEQWNCITGKIDSADGLTYFEGSEENNSKAWIAENNYYDFYYLKTSINGKSVIFVIAEPGNLLSDKVDSVKDLSTDFLDGSAENGIYTFAVNRDTEKFECFYDKDRCLTSENINDHGLTISSLNNAIDKNVSIDGKSYSISTVDYSSSVYGNLILVYAEASKAFWQNMWVRRLFWDQLIILFVTVVFGLYGYMLLRRKRESASLKFDKKMFIKLIAFSVFQILIATGGMWIVHSVSGVSSGMKSTCINAQKLDDYYVKTHEESEVRAEYDSFQILATANVIAAVQECSPYYLNEDYNEEYCRHTYRYTPEDAQEGDAREYVRDRFGNILRSYENSQISLFCQAFNLAEATIYNEDGYAIATSGNEWCSVLDWNEDSDTYPLTRVLDQIDDCYILETDDGMTIAVQTYLYIKDLGNGETEYVKSIDWERQQDADEQDADGQKIVETEGLLVLKVDSDYGLAVDADTDMMRAAALLGFEGETRIIDSIDELLEDTSLGFTLPDDCNADGYYSFGQKSNSMIGIRYCENAEKYVVMILADSEIFNYRTESIIALIIILFVFFLITGILISIRKKAEHPEADAQPAHRFFRRRNSHSVESNIGIIEGIMFGLFLVLWVLDLVFERTFMKPYSLIYAIQTQNWERGLHFFAFCYCGMVCIMIIVGLLIIKFLINNMEKIMAKRAQTIFRLVLSIAKYTLVIFGIMKCLYMMGVDGSSLLTSAGLLTAIIGFGSQQLVGDFISGIFMVFENDCKVGDYVQIDDFTGIVKSIGQRNTKVVNIDGNIMTISNSKIGKMINLSDEMSSISIKVNIPIKINFSAVEEILNNGLKEKIQNKSNLFLEMPHFVGVSEVGNHSYKVLILGKCLEKRRYDAEREVNRVILEILKEHPELVYKYVIINNNND